ncbi:3'-5' exonuclease [Nocardioides sp. Soil805]|uniref:3'-5' exonuclease n=1 Tax=Nocardioides sp. Soil805 TaxID=1736416 RepID=UPI000702B903|nr:3'-5' exonuclease [Nocardioides sp. Soil805]KRF37391.1 hypothetical protein ASG94_08700 [Nocardioides sp. Soil805]
MGLGQREMFATVERALVDSGADVWITDSDALPPVLANHPRCGLIAIDAAGHFTDSEATVALNRKVATLRSSVPEVARTPVVRHLVDTAHLADLTDGSWLDDLPDRVHQPEATRALATYFGPRVTIEVPVRAPMRDAGASDRAAHRIRLDAQQAEAALRDVDGMLAITGPPGSGKTLVLCARANRLAEQHPDWDIRVLCYNRMLAPYLKKLTSAHPNIRVNTVGNFSASLGVRMSLNDPDRAWRDLDAAVRRGLVPAIDAVLIDEWQDFYPAWTALAERVLRPGRGGIVVAGDPKQALYHDLGMDKPVSIPLKTLTLTRPYRSTRQILDVTSALGKQLDVEGRDHAFEGEPVDLVWATTSADQAASVARDVVLLLQSGARVPQDIGVLVTRKWAMGGVARALDEADVPCHVVYPSQAEDLDLAEPKVKILTVHSAKGLEFDVVFLVGLEQLPDPDGTNDVDRQGRTAYVGATRARDQLVLSYSKDNAYLERIRALPEATLRRWVWPDDYPEA